jgi:uncharacterized protein YjeT (DUF2065 family)
MWDDWYRAICLLFVLEGIVPFLYPQRWRSLVARIATVPDKYIRITGLASMLTGVALLYMLN